MTDRNHEGGQDPNGGGLPEYIAFGLEKEVTFLADGSTRLNELVGTSDGVSEGEIREAAAQKYGVDPDSFKLTQLDGDPRDPEVRERARRRGSVAFSSSRWNSSWNPGADPNMN